MPIQFKCPGCSQIMKTPDGSGGKQTKCPRCGTIMRIPGGTATSAAPPTRPAPQQLSVQQPNLQRPSPQRPSPQRPAPQPSSQPPANPFAGQPTGPGLAGRPTYPAATPAPQNPYSTPMSQGGGAYRAPTMTNPVRVPAICLIVLASLHVALLVFELIRDIVRLVSGAAILPGNEIAAEMDPIAIFGFRLFFYVIFFTTMGLIIYGSVCALNLRNRGLAMTAMVLAVIPCCGSPCVFFGIPFGIWGIVAISNATSANLYR